jgi:DNA polymerase-3 subunit delta
VLPEGLLEHESVESAVADVARYDVFAASEAWLAGDAARAARILGVLESEGDGPQLALWSLGEDVHAIAAVQAMTRAGTPMQAALRNARVWGKRAVALERATRRLDAATIDRLLAALARVDALSKGLGRGSPWDELVALALAVAGSPVRRLEDVARGVPA